MNQLYVRVHICVYIYPPHLDHHGSLSTVPCAIQEVLISYLFYT